VKETDLREMLRKVFKSVCIPITVESPDPLSLIPSTSTAVRITENSDKDPDDLEPADEGDIQMEYRSG